MPAGMGNAVFGICGGVRGAKNAVQLADVIAQGADPVVVGALGLTAGYCGTLMTPMAANFNILPAALLETKNKYIVILSQLPVALVMLAVHIVLMYTLAFR